MKNNKIILLILALAGSSFLWGQQAVPLNNGRDQLSKPKPVTESAAAPATTSTETFNGSDFDVPAQVNRAAETDTHYPQDIDILGEELNATASPRQLVEKVNLMSTQIEALLLANEELRRENELIRKSLSNCCSSGDLGLEAKDAYLLQNAPNPFSAASEVRYYVPESMTDARVEIADLKGVVVQTIELQEKGLNSVNFDAGRIGNGSFVYTLYVEGQIIDSRIMIINK